MLEGVTIGGHRRGRGYYTIVTTSNKNQGRRMLSISLSVSARKAWCLKIPKRQCPSDAKPLTSIMPLHCKYHIDNHRMDFDCDAYKAKKPKRHFQSPVTVHTKLIGVVSNLATQFNKWALLAKGYVWSSYLGKVMLCMSDSR